MRRSLVLLLPLLLAAAPAAAPEMKAGYESALEGQWEAARDHFREADKLSAGDARILNNLAVSAEAMGDFARARGYYEAALKLEPDNRQLKENYAAFRAYSRRLPDLWPASDPVPVAANAGAPR
jgi:Flp pilus assembly protein TadD